jgi:predicted enzyme related to lactoylglutathione lyase
MKWRYTVIPPNRGRRIMVPMDFQPTPGQLAHFSVNVDDMARAQAFYAGAFGWQFHAYGPPGFFMVEPGPSEIKPVPNVGSIQMRRSLLPDVKMHGFECTIAVADIDETISKVEALGGKIVMAKCTLPSIGHLIFLQDTEGNLLGAMQYDSNAG